MMAPRTPAKRTKPVTPKRRRRADPLRVHDDIRFGTAQFRPIVVDTTASSYTATIARSAIRLTGPTLYAVAETARLHRHQLGGTTLPPIYTHADGRYTWWDGEVTDSDSRLRQWLRLYIAALWDVSISAVRVSGPPTPP